MNKEPLRNDKIFQMHSSPKEDHSFLLIRESCVLVKWKENVTIKIIVMKKLITRQIVLILEAKFPHWM